MKNRRMKMTFLWMSILLLFAMLSPMQLRAQETGKSYEAKIIDDADLLTDAEEEQLYEDMQPLLSYGNVVFYSVVLNTSNYEKHSQDTYYNLYGQEPGVIFQIDMGNRKLTLSASTKMEEYLSSERDSIVDNIYTLASDGNYYGCAAECFREINLVINNGEIAHSMKYIDNAIFALILALILNFLFVFTTAKKKVSRKKLLGAMAISSVLTSAAVKKGRVSKKYDPPSSSSGGGGGGFSGGGGGGGFSGGSSSHGF